MKTLKRMYPVVSLILTILITISIAKPAFANQKQDYLQSPSLESFLLEGIQSSNLSVITENGEDVTNKSVR